MQERAVKTRETILNEAIRIFAARGPAGATVDEIACAAGANKQRIYAYFGSKDALFAAALREVFTRARLVSSPTLREAQAHPERLTGLLLQSFFKVHETHPEFWRLLAWANLGETATLDVLDDVRKDENQLLRNIFDQAVRTGVLRRVKFESYLVTLLSVSYFLTSNRATLSRTLGAEFLHGIEQPELTGELEKLFSNQH